RDVRLCAAEHGPGGRGPGALLRDAGPGPGRRSRGRGQRLRRLRQDDGPGGRRYLRERLEMEAAAEPAVAAGGHEAAAEGGAALHSDHLGLVALRASLRARGAGHRGGSLGGGAARQAERAGDRASAGQFPDGGGGAFPATPRAGGMHGRGRRGELSALHLGGAPPCGGPGGSAGPHAVPGRRLGPGRRLRLPGRRAAAAGRDQQHRGLQRLRGAHRFGGPAAAAGAGDADRHPRRPEEDLLAITPGVHAQGCGGLWRHGVGGG
ncbi:unnamed protein product, partial [Effrenium voratum]